MSLLPRTRGNLLAIIDLHNVENDPMYQRRDVTGDGVPETFCNLFVHRVTNALGCQVPHVLANKLFFWLGGTAGKAAGWKKVVAQAAAEQAELGYPVIATWLNPKKGGHGHVAMVVPAIDGTGMHIAQAGRLNFSNAPFALGFGALRPDFYTHI